jgi:hypothetical protein
MFEVTVSGPPSLHSPTRAAWTSSAAHALLALIVLSVFIAPRPDAVQQPFSSASTSSRVVWIPAGAGGGGGGGGDRSRDAGSARERGTARHSVPASPPAPDATPDSIEPPPEPIAIAAVPVGSVMATFVGVIAPAATVNTAGPGENDGAGTRPGGGRGDRPGNGLGDGRDQGSGNVFGPGNDVSMPQLVRDVRPRYTADAMRAKVRIPIEINPPIQPITPIKDWISAGAWLQHLARRALGEPPSRRHGDRLRPRAHHDR